MSYSSYEWEAWANMEKLHGAANAMFDYPHVKVATVGALAYAAGVSEGAAYLYLRGRGCHPIDGRFRLKRPKGPEITP